MRKTDPIQKTVFRPKDLDAKSDKLVELRHLVAEFGVLCLEPDEYLDPDEQFRVRDIFVRDGKAVARQGPRAGEADGPVFY